MTTDEIRVLAKRLTKISMAHLYLSGLTPKGRRARLDAFKKAAAKVLKEGGK